MNEVRLVKMVSGGKPLLLAALLCYITSAMSVILDNVTTVLLMTPCTIRLAASLSSYSSDEETVRTSLQKKVQLLRKFLKKKRLTTNGRLNPLTSSEANLQELKTRKISVPLLLKSSVALLFTVVMFCLHSVADFNLSLGWIALLGAILLLILADNEPIDGVLGRVEWGTLLFFASLFILMEATARLGFIRWIGTQTENVILTVDESSRLTVAILLILWVSALASAFVDNIPLTTMMIRIIEKLNIELGLPLQPLVWSLAFGACLGGEILF
ncbi:hypothetical protein C0J52_13582 [Blattella germanica]|nr:hypothetical protein C0J52_13582 [Blattella germanica]